MVKILIKGILATSVIIGAVVGIVHSSMRPVTIDNSATRKLDIKDKMYTVYMSDSTGKMKATYNGKNKYGVIIVEKSDSSKSEEEKSRNTYVLEPDKPEIIGFTYGNGGYTIKVCDYTGSKNLELKEEYNIAVNTSKETSVFEGTSYYTNYGAEVDKIIKEINYGGADEFVDEAYKYVTTHIKYNKNLATSVINGSIDVYKPDLTKIISSEEGICLDQASLMDSIVRGYGIPAKVVVGYNENNQYHAWIEAYIGGKWLLYDTTLKRTYKDKVTESYVVKKYY